MLGLKIIKINIHMFNMLNISTSKKQNIHILKSSRTQAATWVKSWKQVPMGSLVRLSYNSTITQHIVRLYIVI